MSELTRKEKVKRLINQTEVLDELEYKEVSYKTDQEINDLYDQHFNQVTEEDFEGFKKVWERLDIRYIEFMCRKVKRIESMSELTEIKKELNL